MFWALLFFTFSSVAQVSNLCYAASNGRNFCQAPVMFNLLCRTKFDRAAREKEWGAAPHAPQRSGGRLRRPQIREPEIREISDQR